VGSVLDEAVMVADHTVAPATIAPDQPELGQNSNTTRNSARAHRLMTGRSKHTTG
jgi:hypothetical protein